MTQNKENQQLKTEETQSNNKEQTTEDKKVYSSKASTHGLFLAKASKRGLPLAEVGC